MTSCTSWMRSVVMPAVGFRRMDSCRLNSCITTVPFAFCFNSCGLRLCAQSTSPVPVGHAMSYNVARFDLSLQIAQEELLGGEVYEASELCPSTVFVCQSYWLVWTAGLGTMLTSMRTEVNEGGIKRGSRETMRNACAPNDAVSRQKALWLAP